MTTKASNRGGGSTVTTFDASAIVSGTMSTARLGSGATGTKFLRGDNTWQTIPGGGDALTSNPLSQFAATTSAQLAGIMTDETGTGVLVFSNSPTLTTPNIGTPASGDATNLVNIPVANATGNLPVANLGSGSGASGTTFWRGDGTWATPAAGGGTITSVSLSGGSTGLTISGSPVTTGAATMTIAGLLTVTNGGTGISSFGTGVATWMGSPTSANLASAITDETGSGLLVFQTSPTLTTPVLGIATVSTLNKVTITQPTTSAALTIANTKTLTYNNSITMTGTDATTMTFPSGSGAVMTADSTAVMTNKSFNTAGTGNSLSINGVAITAVQGTGAVVLSTNPVMTLTSATALPISTGVAGLGSGVATFLATASSANLASAITDETGTGLLVFNSSPSLTTPTADAYRTTTTNVTTQTVTTYTLVSADAGKLIKVSTATAATLTVTTGLTPGFWCNIAQVSAGQVSVTTGGATTISASNGLKTRTTHSVLTLLYYGATDTYNLGGDSTT